VLLEPQSGAVDVPPYAIIRGRMRADFFMLGLRPVWIRLVARPLDNSYETAVSKINVADGAGSCSSSNFDRSDCAAGDRRQRSTVSNVVVRGTVTQGLLEPNLGFRMRTGWFIFAGQIAAALLWRRL